VSPPYTARGRGRYGTKSWARSWARFRTRRGNYITWVCVSLARRRRTLRVLSCSRCGEIDHGLEKGEKRREEV